MKNPERFTKSPRLILVAGLHGSGKSTFLRSLKSPDLQIFDDFMAHSLHDRREFHYCRHNITIHKTLELKGDLALADTRLCDPAFREEIFSGLGNLLTPYEIVWHCFEPDLRACRDNLIHRSKNKPWNHTRTETTHNQALKKIYTFPPGATTHQVIRGRSSLIFLATIKAKRLKGLLIKILKIRKVDSLK